MTIIHYSRITITFKMLDLHTTYAPNFTKLIVSKTVYYIQSFVRYYITELDRSDLYSRQIFIANASVCVVRQSTVM